MFPSKETCTAFFLPFFNSHPTTADNSTETVFATADNSTETGFVTADNSAETDSSLPITQSRPEDASKCDFIKWGCIKNIILTWQ